METTTNTEAAPAKEDKGLAVNNVAKIDEETQKIVFEHLEKKKTELAETEARLDRKTQELRAILNEMKQEGKGVKSPEQNDPEEEAKKAAMKLIAGSGFENKIRL